MHKIFSFKGVVRNTDNMLADEGECLEVMNMRIKDGSLVPVGRPVDVAALGYAYSRILWHEAAGYYLCITDEQNPALHIYDKEWTLQKDSDGNLLFPSLRGVCNVEFMGYIVCCITDTGIFYILYNDGRYIWLGERPPMPSLDITIQSKLSRTVTENEYYTSGNEGIESTWYYNAKGFFDEAISTHNRGGYYIDRALFKFALRLYDGSYIAVSPAMYVSDDNEVSGIKRDSGNLKYEASGNTMPSKYIVMVLGFKPKFVFSDINLENWKNIVVGIDLFTTGSIMGKKVESVRRAASSVGGDRQVAEYDVYTEKSLEELSGDITSAAHYYRIAEYDIEGRLVDSLDNVSQLNLVLQPSLANDECRYSSLAPSCSYMFNNRLHIAALKSWFFKGYDPLFLKNAAAAKAVVEHIVIKTRIKTIQGVSAVVREYRNVELPYGSNGFELSPLLSYPDARAFEMCITLYDGSKYVSRSFALTPHRHLDQAQYMNCETLSATEDTADICNIPVDSRWKTVGGDIDVSETNPYELRENVLKVSAVENPFVFPAKCTYTPTQGRVVALASNTVELSQGQFGQHPLFLFCSDGIWAMSVDASGAVAYLGSYPLSREVCVNPDSVCGIDGAVVFVGRRGVMLISGGKLKNISSGLEGSADAVEKILTNRLIANILTMMQLPACSATVGFTDYLTDATIGYLPALNEIVVANSRFGYSYIYSLQSGSWSCVDIVADGFISHAAVPALFVNGIAGCKVKRFVDSYSGDNKVFLLTRPQLWGTKLPKRIIQLMLHTYAAPVSARTTGLPAVACYMFGSNDGINYGLLAGRECDGETQDLKFPYFPSQSYRYYLFAVCGELSSRSRVTGLEIEMQPAWNNRMR